MKTLIAGPWVGEFGWELFAWQGYVRAMSRKFDKTIVISRDNSKALYDDFTNEFISYDPTGGLADSYFMHNVDIKECLRELVESKKVSLNKDTTLMLPRRIGFPPHTHYSQFITFGSYLVKGEYLCLGEKTEKKYDFIFHIRDRDLRKEDNWSLDNWYKLRELLGKDKKIACIGTKNESGWIEGTYDLRDISLKEIINALRNSGCAFGSSSGPMHLASLCECPHVVWSIPSNKVRYEENWNPLSTKVLFISEHAWHPTPESIYKYFLKWRDDE